MSVLYLKKQAKIQIYYIGKQVWQKWPIFALYNTD